jgi:hypothetical protein
MSFSEKSVKRIDELVKTISSADSNRLYLSTPSLLEIERIAKEELSEKNDSETLLDGTVSFRFVAECYYRMMRPCEAGRLYTCAIEAASMLYRQHGVLFEGFDETVIEAVKCRNSYVFDSCEDIFLLCFGIATESTLADAKKYADPQKRPFIKRDPVEMTREYLDVIDAVEEKIENNRSYRGHGSCHHVWELKKGYLMEYGIEWKSPGELNPGVMFD